MSNEDNGIIINTSGNLRPMGFVDPNGGFARGNLPDGSGGAFTSAGVPSSLQAAGAEPFTTNFTESKQKNEDRKDLAIAGKAISALMEEDLEAFDELSSQLTHGFIVGSGVGR